MAGGVSLFPISRLRQRWRAGRSDHDDVQPHGGAAEVVIERSLREDHGVLSHAARSRSTPIGDLCWLSETQTPGRNSRGSDVYYSRHRGDDHSELAIRYLR